MARRNDVAGASGRTRSDWEALIRKFEQGGISRQRFCADAAIAVSTFDYWRRKFRREDPAAAGFIELPPMSSRSDWDVELDLGGSVVLRLRRR
jgi:putative transposase